MRNIEILVDGKPLDVERLANIPIKLTYLLQDLENFDKRAGYFSNKFTIPATKRTNIAFGYYYDPKMFDAYLKFTFAKPCIVVANGITVFNGTMVGESVERQRGLPISYSVQLVGQNLAWAEYMKVNPLTSATSLACPTFFWGEAEVRNSWTNTYNTGGWTAPLVCYGQFTNYSQSATWAVKTWEMRPWIFVRGIFERMFNLAGYNLVSNFVQTDLFSKLIIYFNDDGSFPTETPAGGYAISYHIPGLISADRKMLDLVRGLVQMFNLYFFTDENTKTVYCEPYANFFDATTFDNWDGKQDISQKSKLSKPTNKARFIELLYGTSDDALHNGLNDSNYAGVTNNWGFTKKHFNCRFDYGQQYENKVEESQNEFFNGCMMLALNFGSQAGNFTNNPVPVLWDSITDPITAPSPLNPYLPVSQSDNDLMSGAMAPRICYYKGMTGTLHGEDWKFEGDAVRQQYPYAYFTDYRKKDGGTYNLNYSDQYLVDTTFQQGLVRKYYLERLAALKRGSFLDTPAIITLSDIQRLDFRRLKTMEGVLWQLLEVSNFVTLEEKATLIKLLKATIPDQDDIDSLTHYDISTWSPFLFS
jgi:hypothetical protein